MLGRIIAIFEKRSDEAIPTSSVRPGCSSYFPIWFNANTSVKSVAEAFEFFSGAGDGACPTGWLVSAVVLQSGKTGRGHFFVEVHAYRLVRSYRAHHGGGGFGEAEGLSQSRLRYEPA
jgi:hypothetical protein